MQITTLRSVDDIASDEWDRLCEEPAFQHAWFRTVEQSGIVDLEPRHLVLREEGRVAGILPCGIQRSDPYYTVHDRLFGRLSQPLSAIGLTMLPALVAASPLMHQSRIFVDERVDRPRAIQALCQAMIDTCRRERLPICAWPFVPYDPAMDAALRGAGFWRAYLCPMAEWDNRFTSFEAYLQDMKRASKHRYRTARYELNAIAKDGIDLQDEPLDALTDEELSALRARHYERYHEHASPFSSAFFSSLRHEYGPRIHAFTARRHGHLLAYALAVQGADQWQTLVGGESSYEDAHLHRLHFSLYYYFPIAQAIASGIRRIIYGLGAYEAKLQRGCRLEPLYLYVYTGSPLLRLWLKPWMAMLDAVHRRKHARFASV